MNDPYVVYESTGVFIPIVKLIQLKHTPKIRPFGTQAQKLQGGRRGSKGGSKGVWLFPTPLWVRLQGPSLFAFWTQVRNTIKEEHTPSFKRIG